LFVQNKITVVVFSGGSSRPRFYIKASSGVLRPKWTVSPYWSCVVYRSQLCTVRAYK